MVSEVRKDEQRRLYEAGDIEAAKALKKTRYILMSKRSTLQKKDQEAEAGRVIHRGSPLFGTANVVRKSGYEEKYDSLLRENALLFTLDLIKEKLDEAYRDTDEARMAEKIIDEGIIAHATFQITSGKVEGINQKIKTLRRHGYGYPDDEYFFLKLFDASAGVMTAIPNPTDFMIEPIFSKTFSMRTRFPRGSLPSSMLCVISPHNRSVYCPKAVISAVMGKPR